MKEHGGNLYKAKEKYSLKHQKIHDFSANINPLGLHIKIKNTIKKNLDYLIHYPDPDCKELIDLAAEFYQIHREKIIPGNGSADTIYGVLRFLHPQKALILAPNFSEYEEALCGINCGITRLAGKEQNNFRPAPEEIIKNLDGHNILIFSNPNNPAGYVYSRQELEYITEKAQKSDTIIFCDEAFMEFCPDYQDRNVLPLLEKYKNLVVSRTLTKLFAVPGLRIGFVFMEEKNAASLHNYLPPWRINTLAEQAAITAFTLKGYAEKSALLVDKNKIFFISGLEACGIKVFPSAANYILCRYEKTPELIDHCGQKGFLLRSCSDYHGLTREYFRAAVNCKKDIEKLLQIIKNFVSSKHTRYVCGCKFISWVNKTIKPAFSIQ